LPWAASRLPTRWRALAISGGQAWASARASEDFGEAQAGVGAAGGLQAGGAQEVGLDGAQGLAAGLGRGGQQGEPGGVAAGIIQFSRRSGSRLPLFSKDDVAPEAACTWKVARRSIALTMPAGARCM
jgi:hypothetical protein